MAADALEKGRTAFGQQGWAQAFSLLAAADHESALGPEDLELLATATYLVGRDDAGEEILGRAYRGRLRGSDPPGAARCAIWLALHLWLAGEVSPARGWLARAHLLLDDGRHDCVEQEYLLVLAGLEGFGQGDPAAARGSFERAAEIGDRFGDGERVSAFGPAHLPRDSGTASHEHGLIHGS